MSTSVATFESNVKDKLMGIISDLIPEEKLDQLIKMQVAEFERNELPKLVRKLLSEYYTEVIKQQMLDGKYLEIVYNPDGTPIATEAIKKLIVEMAPDILANMIGVNIQYAVEHMKNTMGALRY